MSITPKPAQTRQAYVLPIRPMAMVRSPVPTDISQFKKNVASSFPSRRACTLVMFGIFNSKKWQLAARNAVGDSETGHSFFMNGMEAAGVDSFFMNGMEVNTMEASKWFL